MRQIFKRIALILLLLPASLRADPQAETLLRDLITDGPRREIFTEAFLNAVPMAQVDALVTNIREEIGQIEEISIEGGAFELSSATHLVSGLISLSPERQIAGLRFLGITAKAADLESALKRFETLGDQVSWLVLRDGDVLEERDSETPLAVGSAFKLAVLLALMEEVAAGNRNWHDVVLIEEGLKSLPSGDLQTFPDQSPVTLHSLAALMIASSDNTATDILMHHLGRDRIAELLETDFVLSTREFFALKLDDAARKAFLADPANRASIAAKAGQGLSRATSVPAYQPGVEWYMSLSRLCDIAERVAHLPLFEINPGLAQPKNWPVIAYKGGSETGVLNLTSALIAPDGTEFCVALTLNASAPIAEKEVFSAYRGVLSQLIALRK